eukprot:CAMPEP_0117004878 /NCGR_PEP_ID=MMETSP0472-20121206/5698_1 /TAXON_ID=693140 ORGANISM="Tiarina fusus, Strain LIS" /NCGR_SAMPLE_ID=MMETSP0472 /ASSEMBLY_ACC=CAM_ASM_000603 /LENGTH=476 /DNA_ID=CAMNT_0004705967 /DNA_START=146 /DNA_END=1576 /DNA_ORIENTATION=+
MYGAYNPPMPSLPERQESPFCCKPTGEGGNRQGRTYIGDDADLANDMNAVSFEEREKVYHDIHGVSELPEETTKLLSTCLEQLDACIAKSRHTNLAKARFLRPKLDTDRDFKLMFLRSTEYDAVKATRRMCDYFDKKCEIFGEDMLVKRITISDLSEEAIECQRSGLLMMLPFKDQSGRPIQFFDFSKINWDPVAIRSHAQWFWYIIMNAVEGDATAQRRGVLSVSYAPGSGLLEPGSCGRLRGLLAPAESISDALPFKLSCTHMCYDDPRFDFLMQIIRVAASRRNRLRMRGHYGSPIEIEYSLLSFGIVSQNTFQRSRQGDLAKQNCEYIETQLRKEKRQAEMEAEDEARTGIVMYPRPNDILIGRGQSYRNYPAAQVFYKIIDTYMDQYLSSKERFEKVSLSIDVVSALRAAGYRMLQRKPSGWEILDAVSERQKVAVAFRSRLPKKVSSPRRVLANGEANTDFESDPKRRRV